MTTTATNPQTGETVVLVGSEWKPAQSVATNAKGEKAFLVDGAWHVGSAGPQAATTGERAQAGLGGVNRGIAGLIGLPVDAVENVLNLGIAGYGSAATALGRPDLAPELLKGSFGGSESIAAGMNKVGIPTGNPRPDDPASRMLHTGGVIAGGSLVPGARPFPTAAAAAGGAVAGETLGPEYTGVGAMAPAGAVQAAQGAKAGIAARVQPRVETFKEAGTFPSVGQATELNFIQGFENLLSKFPGGQGVFRQFSERQQRQLGDTAKTGVSAEDAGRAIERGITGEGGFVSRFKAQQDVLYNRLDTFIPKYEPINVTNTTRALTSINEGVPGAPNLSQYFINSKMKGIEGALAKDLEQASVTGALPYESIKKLRSLVGKELADATIASDVPKSKWKALYGALSEDLGAAAAAKGPKAEETWKLANNYTKAGLDRIEGVLERVIGKTPEETFARFMPKDADQANKVRAVMRSLDPEQRQIVQEAVVNRLGRATPGKQSEAGDVFSPETFLTNWNKLSPGAKQQLFADPQMLRNVDSLAKVTDNLRSGAKVFANPSGSAGAAAPYGIGYLMATGDMVTAGTLLGGAYIGAKMLTNRAVVDWLAKAPTVKPEAAQAHLARLGVIYNETKDPELKAELGKYVSSIK